MSHGQHYAQFTNNTASSWWKDGGMRKGFIHIFILYSAVYSLGYDGSLLIGLQALPEWVKDFDAPSGTRLGLIAATSYLPKIPMTFVIAYLVDKYGRKLTVSRLELMPWWRSYGMTEEDRAVAISWTIE